MHKVTRQVEFRVKGTVSQEEQIFIVGSCEQLGNWEYNKAVPLSHLDNNTEGDIWCTTVEIPASKVVHYRYFVGQNVRTPDNHRVIIVKKWETHLQPRVVEEVLQTHEDVLGIFDGLLKLDKGWLTHQDDVQLRLYSNALTLWSEQYEGSALKIKCSPNSLVNQPMNSENDLKMPNAAFSNNVLISILNENDSTPKQQGKDGVPYLQDQYAIYRAQTMDLTTQGYIFEVYCCHTAQNQADNGTLCPVLIGITTVLPVHLQELSGIISLPLISPTCKPVGQLRVDLLVTKALQESCPPDMSVSYQRYWNRNQGTQHMGHRGMGVSFGDRFALVTENTIGSFSEAGKHGADFVEFDVMLTKDKVPVIYHDFKICVENGHKNSAGIMKEIALNELTLEELQSLKIYHTDAVTKGENIKLSHDGEASVSEKIFPTLKQAFDHVTPSICFNIEVKYAITMCDGSLEGGLMKFTERNEYLDTIIQDVLENAGSRKVVFSCFDPDVCSMLRLKQNRYPVNMLTMGATDRWPPYKDIRTQSVPMAVYVALAEEILGINAHTEDLLKDMKIISKVKNSKLVLWTWGPDNNNTEVISKLQQMGVDGICYDRVHELKPREILQMTTE